MPPPSGGIEPIFLLSSGRSGSTVVQRVLGSHSQIATTAEPWILLPLLIRGPFPDAPRGLVGHIPAAAIEDFSETLRAGRSDYHQAVHDFVLGLYSNAAEGAGNRYFVDKTPYYSLIVDEIVRVFPEAKLIFLWRNPVSVMASAMSFGRASRQRLPVREAFEAFESMVLLNTTRLVAAYERHRERAIAVRYEDLMTGRAEWRRLMEYLDLPFEDEMLERFAELELPGRLGDARRRTYVELSEEPLGKWRQTIDTPVRRAWCRRYLGKIGRRRLAVMGYNLDELLHDLDSARTGDFSQLRSDPLLLLRLVTWRASKAGIHRRAWPGVRRRLASAGRR